MRHQGLSCCARSPQIVCSWIRKSEFFMQYKKFGRTGLTVSRLCLGTMTFGLQIEEDVSRSILDKAADAGVNFIDTADVYPLGGDEQLAGRTEEIVGRWLKRKRERLI